MATLEQIQAKLQKLQAQADALVAKNSSAVIEKIRQLMAQHDLSIADIEAHTGKAKGGAKRGGKPAVAATEKPAASAPGKLPPKYLNPKTGETWSGHARPPAWIKNVKDRSKFLIAGNVEQPTKHAGKSTRTGNYVRGPQPAMYRNPETGAEWSGRGRAPAWLTSAKDRSKFLIDFGAAIAADASVASKTKQATKKATPVAKKASAKTVKATTARAVKKAATKKSVSAKRAAPQSTTSKKSAGKTAAPTVKRTAVKKASATQAVVANDTVAKADVAAAPESLAAQATA